MSLPDVRIIEIESALLRNNPMGDSSLRRLPVYLPPGHDMKRKEPYPIVFLLSGWSGRGARYLNDEGAFLPSFPDQLDQLIRDKKLPPLVIAFPDCTTKLGASQYVNSEANGPHMDHLCDELLTWCETNLNVSSESRFHGTIGHSSGGFGSLALGMIRPDRFANICSSAGDSWYEWLYVQPIPMMMATLGKAGGPQRFIEKFLGSPNPLGLLSREDFETMMNLSMCACYAPNLSVPLLKGDLYFDLKTGDLIPEVWKKFLSWDPVHMVNRYSSNLKKLRWIHLEAGTEDEYALHVGHRRIAARFDTEKISYKMDEYPGRHGGHHYRMPERIRRMVERMYAD